MIEEILPPAVASAEAFSDPPDAFLFPEEEARLTRAVAKRRREFTTARACAREALATLGVGPVPILPGERGAPEWPAGIVGSMTHSAAYRAAAVARASEVVSVGIDAEPHEPLPKGVQRTIALPAEVAMLGRLAARHPAVHWGRLLFCAKEATYKAWFPLAQRWLGFDEAEITVDPGDGRAGTFSTRLLVPGPIVAERPLTGFTGRWLVDTPTAMIATAITVPPALSA